MRERFIELVEKISAIEKLFHRPASIYGLAVPTVDEIHDVQEFQIWLQEVTLEVQEIADRTGDGYASDTLRALTSPFNGWNDRRDFNNIKGRAGRMFKHYVGRIFILNDEPQQELPLVDIPAMTLPDNLPVSMAMEVEENAVDDLSEGYSR